MHDAQIRVAIAGAGGRMGRQLIQAALQMDGVALGAALEREGSSLLGADAGELAGAGDLGGVAVAGGAGGRFRFLMGESAVRHGGDLRERTGS